MKIVQVKRKTFNMLLLVFPIAVLSKIYQYNFTSAVNFGIIADILALVNSGNIAGTGSTPYSAKVYTAINFFGLTTTLEWSIYLTTVFTIIIFCFLLKYFDYTLLEYLFIYATMFILCWTVMNAGKDLIQLIFLLIVFVICDSKLKEIQKIILTCAVFFYESLVFRSYYILLVALIVIVYFVLQRELKNERKKNILLNLGMIIFLFFVMLFVAKFLAYDSYEALITRRDSLEGWDSVTTIIQDLVPGEGFIVYILNYLINFVRILFPFELLQYGFKQIIFFAYQLINTFVLILAIIKVNKKNILYVTVVLAYVLMMVASESDFGTLARHQSVLIMFYVALFKSYPKKDELPDE